MKSGKIAKEVAEQEFERMCSLARVDTAAMGAKELVRWKNLTDDVVGMICSGRLSIDESGRGMVCGLTFGAATGAALMAMQTYADSKTMANLAAAMAEMTGQPAATFGKMHSEDFMACARVAQVFLPKG